MKSTIVCAGGAGKDGMQNQIFYRDDRGWQPLTSLPVRRRNFAICVVDRLKAVILLNRQIMLKTKFGGLFCND